MIFFFFNNFNNKKSKRIFPFFFIIKENVQDEILFYILDEKYLLFQCFQDPPMEHDD
jgi:hypothetical protein